MKTKDCLLVYVLICLAVYCMFSRPRENFTQNFSRINVKWNTKGGLENVTKLIFVRSVGGKKVQEHEVKALSDGLNYKNSEITFDFVGDSVGKNTVTVYKDSVSQENVLFNGEVDVQKESTIMVKDISGGKPLDTAQGWQPKGSHVWNELNTPGQTKEKCIEHAKLKGYVAWGFRNADHTDNNYKNTCWFYNSLEPHNGTPDDFIHSTGCTNPDMKVSEGCGRLKMGIKGLDRWGGDIQNFAADLETCKRKCMSHNDCIGISHNKEMNYCYLKGYPGKTVNQMKNHAPAGGWQWYYRVDKPYSNSNISNGLYNTEAKGTHIEAIGKGFEWNKNMTWEGCARKAKELGFTAFGYRNANDTCFFEKGPFNPYDGTAPLSNQGDNAYAMACTDPKKTITSGCRTESARDDTKVLAGYNWGPHENREPWSDNSGTLEDCRLNAKKLGYKGYGYRTDMHPDGNWKQRCYYFTQGHIDHKPDWKGNLNDGNHIQGCVDPSKDWPKC